MTLKCFAQEYNDQPMDPTKYRQMVGALQYLTFTYLDITFVINRVCQYFQTP